MRLLTRQPFLWAISVIPSGWIFGLAIQYQWIQQRCGTPDLLQKNKHLCADNEIRMLFGGPVTSLVVVLLFVLVFLPFHNYLKDQRARIGRRIALAFQTLELGAIVFYPAFCREQAIVFVGLLFAMFVIWTLRHDFLPLRRKLFPEAPLVQDNANVDDAFFQKLFYFALVFHAVFVLVGFTNPITDHHSFRQTQTAMSTYWLVQDGFKLWYETPMFGKPWSVPMEFPLYQYICALLVRWTGLGLEPVSRAVSIVSFYALVVVLARFLKDILIKRSTRLLILSLVLTTPLHVYYARTVLIEIFTLFLGCVWLWATFRYVRTGNVAWVLPVLIFGSACALSKVTTFAALGFVQLGVFWSGLKTPLKENFKLRNLLFWLCAGLCAVVIPLIVGYYWVIQSDLVKMQNPIIGEWWSSKGLKEWNFGTLELRLSFAYWRSIFLSNLNDILGYLGIPILIVLVASLVKLSSRENIRSVFLFVSFFFAPLVFSNLFFVHDYYYVACAILLIVAVGLKLGEFYERSGTIARRNIIRFLVVPLIMSMQLGYFGEYFKKQLDGSIHAASRIADVIKQYTRNQDVVIAHGYAAPELPYYARRKMLVEATGDVRRDEKRFLTALYKLKPDRVGAVLIPVAWTDEEKQRVMRMYRHKIDFKAVKRNTVEGYEVYTKP